jgi:hypothetical protein
MDLNDFIFRDDAAAPLGADADDAYDVAPAEETGGYAKAGLAAIGGAVLGLSHFLGHVTKDI